MSAKPYRNSWVKIIDIPQFLSNIKKFQLILKIVKLALYRNFSINTQQQIQLNHAK